jgi:hypothetical protein
MPPINRRSVLLAAGNVMAYLLDTPISVAAATPRSDMCVAPAIKSTFIQPLNTLRGRGPQYWLDHMANLQQLGISEVYLQWMEINNTSFVVPGEEHQLLAPILAAAEQSGVGLRFGLSTDLAGTGLYYAAPTKLAAYLTNRRQASLSIAAQLQSVAAPSPAFRGWYLPEEIDDLAISDAARSRVWLHHLVAIVDDLKVYGGQADVAISTYVTGAQQPTQFGAFWGQVWDHVPLTVLVQDGYGVNHLPTPSNIKHYYTAINREAARRNRDWGIIIELFQQTEGPPINEGPYKDIPAPIERIVEQIALAEKFPKASRAAYSVHEHMAQTAGVKARALADAFRLQYCSPGRPDR